MMENSHILIDTDLISRPFICPVCSGNGFVPNGFYNQTSGCWSSTSLEPEVCRSCNGTGIVWSNNKKG
jgi:DnaJ-class molecular chaperone